MNIKPCVMCDSEMVLRQIGSTEPSQTEERHDDCYFIYCRSCGYGPAHNFDSVQHAAHYWDDACLAV